MNDLNSFCVTGRVTHEIELKTSKSGTPYLSFSIANNRKNFMNNFEGTANFFKIIIFGKRAEGLAKFLEKGSYILVNGELVMSDYENEDGEIKRSWTILPYDVQMVNTRRKEESEDQEQQVEEDELEEAVPF